MIKMTHPRRVGHFMTIVNEEKTTFFRKFEENT